jgi:hypothetical protein
MLFYPKIPGSRNVREGKCLAFVKYDGTNLHWVWERDFGWHAFGTRRDRFDFTEAGIDSFSQMHNHLRECVAVFRETLADQLEAIFLTHPSYREIASITAFTEFFGPGSFAGLHKREDKKELRLFDILVEPLGILDPSQFVNDFAGLPIAEVVYEGKLTGKFTEEIRRGVYPVDEGVVCKGRKREGLWRVKIKTNAYLEKLKAAFAEPWEEFWE